MALANLLDVIFCSWLIFACEQLQHLKAIMKPLMELSAALDTYRPNTAELFRVSSTGKQFFLYPCIRMSLYFTTSGDLKDI